MHLGIEKHTGAVFEGFNNPELPVHPKPAVSQCHLIAVEDDWKKMPGGLYQDAFRWVFREDSFDPVSRIRRGRVYQPYGGAQPDQVIVMRDPSPDSLGKGFHATTHTRLDMYRYMACTALLVAPKRVYGLTFVIGSGAGISAYTIVQIETLVTGDVMVTLKAKTAFGVIPDLKESAVPEASRKPVRQALERVVNSAFRETAVSVVDQCRNAMATMLAHFLAAEDKAEDLIRKELAPLSKMLTDRQMEVCGSAALIVARMHSRGKSNEQHAKGLREPVDEDAEFAVHALGLVMREIGWAA